MGLFNPKVEKPKEFTITDTELSEYSFYAMQIKARQEELHLWQIKIKALQDYIKNRVGLKDSDEFHWELDWSKIFSTMKFWGIKQPNIKVKTENDKPELQPKQG